MSVKPNRVNGVPDSWSLIQEFENEVYLFKDESGECVVWDNGSLWTSREVHLSDDEEKVTYARGVAKGWSLSTQH